MGAADIGIIALERLLPISRCCPSLAALPHFSSPKTVARVDLEGGFERCVTRQRKATAQETPPQTRSQ